jgi:cysteinyl-tRNA synthetase
MLNKELQQRLAHEYRYAVTRMQNVTDPNKKLYYFSIFYGEAQRVLNLQWDTQLAMLYMATQFLYNNIRALIQSQNISIIPFNAQVFFNALEQISADIATYYEKATDDINELHRILGRIAEVGYTTTGNGSYLLERGIITL